VQARIGNEVRFPLRAIDGPVAYSGRRKVANAGVRLLSADERRKLHRQRWVAKGISQDDLALIAGVERSHTGHLEPGSKNPKIKTFEKIAIALSCDISELFAILPM
jgi:DNA-binding XRE family transcriptional regulator